jgi:hypothetical protein
MWSAENDDQNLRLRKRFQGVVFVIYPFQSEIRSFAANGQGNGLDMLLRRRQYWEKSQNQNQEKSRYPNHIQ